MNIHLHIHRMLTDHKRCEIGREREGKKTPRNHALTEKQKDIYILDCRTS